MWDEQGWMLVGFLSALFPLTEQSGQEDGRRTKDRSLAGNWVGGLSGLLLAQTPRRMGTIQLRGGEGSQNKT